MNASTTAASSADPILPRIGDRCLCGAELPARKPSGRPRISCSLRCARRREHLQRMVRRRVDWLHAWHNADGYAPADVTREVTVLERELLAVLRQLHG